MICFFSFFLLFGDPEVDSRLTWGHPGSRTKNFERSIQLTYPGLTPVGLVFWSDSASPSNGPQISFHPIMLRLFNDPNDKYTLIGLIPSHSQSTKKSYTSYFKLNRSNFNLEFCQGYRSSAALREPGSQSNRGSLTFLVISQNSTIVLV